MNRFFIALTLMLLNIAAFSQNKISGKVTNANGEPLIQASVFLVSTYHAASNK